MAEDASLAPKGNPFNWFKFWISRLSASREHGEEFPNHNPDFQPVPHLQYSMSCCLQAASTAFIGSGNGRPEARASHVLGRNRGPGPQ